MESDVRQWVRQHLAQQLGIEPSTVDFDQGLEAYGMDSVDAVLMAGELETAFTVEVDPAVFLQHPTFEALIQSLEEQLHMRSDAVPSCPAR